ncbi:MAG: 50S ribosomal protein L29 [Mycoplasmataceae bacterium]|nr:50S ribosomal protein L29 [Mycoplasmataceae bacterium]
MNKELKAKTNEELCSLIMRLKLQLLESRFRMAHGELEKTNVLYDIRKTIARAMTILTQRHIKLTIGVHGITMYNTQTKEVKSITNAVEQALKAHAENKKNLTEKEAIKQATIASANADVANTNTNEIKEKVTPIAKKELKSHMEKPKADSTVIRKTVGGGS